MAPLSLGFSQPLTTSNLETTRSDQTSQIFLIPSSWSKVLTVDLPLLTIPLRQDQILIPKILAWRKTSLVVENADESNFGEGQGRSDQTPECSPIRNSGHDTGDFVFIRRK
jgi:hypothetical protein